MYIAQAACLRRPQPMAHADGIVSSGMCVLTVRWADCADGGISTIPHFLPSSAQPALTIKIHVFFFFLISLRQCLSNALTCGGRSTLPGQDVHFSTTGNRGLSSGSRFQSLMPWKHSHRLLQTSLHSWAANVTGRVSDTDEKQTPDLVQHH